jgi:hypothetical protein
MAEMKWQHQSKNGEMAISAADDRAIRRKKSMKYGGNICEKQWRNRRNKQSVKMKAAKASMA